MELNEATINAIGLWSFRIILAVGGIVVGLYSNEVEARETIAVICAIVVALSFVT